MAGPTLLHLQIKRPCVSAPTHPPETAARCIHAPAPSKRQSHFSRRPLSLCHRLASLERPAHPSHRRRRAQTPCCCSTAAVSVAEPPGDLLLRRLARVLVVAAAVAAWIAVSRGSATTPFASLTAAVSSLPRDRLQPALRSGWAGLAAGCLHSLSGPDHLAALTPLTFGRGQVKASFLGALWGFGHCIGQLVLGLLLLILKDRFTQFVPTLSKYSSTTVALTLLIIGAMGLYETIHTHREAELQLIGIGGSGTDPTTIPITATPRQAEQHQQVQQQVSPFTKDTSLWTLGTGVVYGLQPDALFVIIPALALPTPLAAVAYMSMFVVGTVTAMGGYTAFIGATSKAIEDRYHTSLLTKLSGVASGIAIAVGFGFALLIVLAVCDIEAACDPTIAVVGIRTIQLTVSVPDPA